MKTHGAFERAMFRAFITYVFLLPMSLALLALGDWWLFALTTGILIALSVLGAILEGHESHRAQRSR